MLKEYKSYKRKKKSNYFAISFISILILFMIISYIFRQNIKNLFLSDSETIVLRQYKEIEGSLLNKQKINQKKYQYTLEKLQLILEQKPQKSNTYFFYAKYYFYLLIDRNISFFQDKKSLIELSSNQTNKFLKKRNLELIEKLFANLLKAKSIDNLVTQKQDYKFLTFFVDLFYSQKQLFYLEKQLEEIDEEGLSSIFLETYYFSAVVLYSLSGNVENLEKYLTSQYVEKKFNLNDLEKKFFYMISSYNKKDYISCIRWLREIQEKDLDKKFFFQTKLLEAEIFFIQKLPLKSINILNRIYQNLPEKSVPKMRLLTQNIVKQYPKLKTYFNFESSL